MITIHDVAAICHETNRAYCEALRDFTQKPWRDAPPWQRQSAENGVKFHLANPDASPSASHEAWLAEKAADRWTYGPVKDEAKKQHPCMVPFGELSPKQQMKDKLFTAIVETLRPLIEIGTSSERTD